MNGFGSTWQLHTDGGSRGNPGPGACAYVLNDPAGNLQDKCGKYLGICTNNVAEYQGIIIGLAAAKKLGVGDLECYLDSELIVRQINGLYKVKSPELKGFYLEVIKLVDSLQQVNFTHIPREKNKEADALVNETLDRVL